MSQNIVWLRLWLALVPGPLREFSGLCGSMVPSPLSEATEIVRKLAAYGGGVLFSDEATLHQPSNSLWP